MNFSGNQNTPLDQDQSRQDRLRKAIMRNRAKRAKREASQSTATPSSPTFQAKQESQLHYPELVSPVQETYGETASQRNSFRRRSTDINWKVPKFKLPNVSISMSARMTKILALFCLFLTYQLIFSDNGIWDYYKMERLLESKQQEYVKTKKLIHELDDEIRLLRHNKKHQKAVTKSKLGVLSKDEFLVLFAPGRELNPN